MENVSKRVLYETDYRLFINSSRSCLFTFHPRPIIFARSSPLLIASLKFPSDNPVSNRQSPRFKSIFSETRTDALRGSSLLPESKPRIASMLACSRVVIASTSWATKRRASGVVGANAVSGDSSAAFSFSTASRSYSACLPVCPGCKLLHRADPQKHTFQLVG